MTTIEWTDETWNPVTGCTKVSQGCKNCYAERLFPRPYPGRAFTDVQFHRDRIRQPLTWRKPRRIFVNSMSDLFHEQVTWEQLDILFAVMALARQHTFQILTKRPKRMLEYFGDRPNSPRHGLWHRVARRFSELATSDDVTGFSFPLPNVWLGVSVEDQATADERIPLLLQTPAAVRFISAEPLLGPVDLNCIELPAEYNLSPTLRGRISALQRDHEDRYYAAPASIDWVIAGGESGPKARPSRPDWFRSLRDQCAAAGVPYFFKQWGEWGPCETETHPDERGREVWPLEEPVLDALSDEVDRRFTVIAEHGMEFARFGKKLNGRTLDGLTHDEYPEVTP